MQDDRDRGEADEERHLPPFDGKEAQHHSSDPESQDHEEMLVHQVHRPHEDDEGRGGEPQPAAARVIRVQGYKREKGDKRECALARVIDQIQHGPRCYQ